VQKKKRRNGGPGEEVEGGKGNWELVDKRGKEKGGTEVKKGLAKPLRPWWGGRREGLFWTKKEEKKEVTPRIKTGGREKKNIFKNVKRWIGKATCVRQRNRGTGGGAAKEKAIK